MMSEIKRNLSVCLSYLDSNMRGKKGLSVFDNNKKVDTKRSSSVCLSKTTRLVKWNVFRLSVLRRFQYEGWNETYFVLLFVLRKFQYEGWNEP